MLNRRSFCKQIGSAVAGLAAMAFAPMFSKAEPSRVEYLRPTRLMAGKTHELFGKDFIDLLWNGKSIKFQAFECDTNEGWANLFLADQTKDHFELSYNRAKLYGKIEIIWKEDSRSKKTFAPIIIDKVGANGEVFYRRVCVSKTEHENLVEGGVLMKMHFAWEPGHSTECVAVSI